jgi:cytochrome c biogenesis factor
VAFIWLGAILMALGGALGLVGRVGRRSAAPSGTGA